MSDGELGHYSHSDADTSLFIKPKKPSLNQMLLSNLEKSSLGLFWENKNLQYMPLFYSFATHCPLQYKSALTVVTFKLTPVAE